MVMGAAWAGVGPAVMSVILCQGLAVLDKALQGDKIRKMLQLPSILGGISASSVWSTGIHLQQTQQEPRQELLQPIRAVPFPHPVPGELSGGIWLKLSVCQ